MEMLGQTPLKPVALGYKQWTNSIFYTPPKVSKFKVLNDLVKGPTALHMMLEEQAVDQAARYPGTSFDESGWGEVTRDGVQMFYNLYLKKYSMTLDNMSPEKQPGSLCPDD